MGILVPYLTLIQGTFEARVMLADFLHGNFSQVSQLGPLAFKLFAMFLAFAGAAIMRLGADHAELCGKLGDGVRRAA